MGYSILYITLKSKKFLEIRCYNLQRLNLVNTQDNLDEIRKD
ncbi:MAG: hypothetical protein AB8U25_00835 [Rickettsiales endosymbiont of Dermacentor nuttalli]